MKDIVLKNYKWYVVGLWVMLALTLSMQLMWTIPPLQILLAVSYIFLICYPTVTFLSARVLPRAMKTGRMKVFFLWLVSMTLLLAFLWALGDVMMEVLERRGVFPHSSSFTGWNEERPFYALYLGSLLTSFMTNMLFCSLRFINEHYRMAQEHAKLKQAHLEDELRMLRSQINPHLMFNVLNHIHILLKKDTDKADDLLVRYADVLRYQLYEANRETVSLAKEVDYLKDVIDVESVRWGAELSVDCSWKVEDGTLEISPLLLIPFVENAFKHVSRPSYGMGYVHISLDQSGNTLRFTVENSRSEQAPRKKNASGLGLENARKRLNILYPGKHELMIQKTDTVYTTTLIIAL